MKFLFRYGLLPVFLLLQTIFCIAQKTDAKAKEKAQNIYNFTKYIRWENQERLQAFAIGILGSEPALANELEKISDVKTVNGKLIFIKQFKNIEEISGVQMLYVNERSGFDIDKILKKIIGSGTLLISENYPYQSSMINFMQAGNFLKFEYNKERIIAEKMKIAPEINEFAIMSDKDWRDFAKQVKGELKNEKEKVEMQQEKLSVMQSDIDKKSKAIEQSSRELERQTKEILAQTKEIDKQKIELGKLIKQSETQKKYLEERSEVLKKQEVEILKQNIEMERQTRILRQKKREADKLAKQIAEQKNTLSEKESEIETQKMTIKFAVAIVLLIAAFGVFILLQYRAKQRINKMLEQQKKLVDDKNKNITASINYARRIQQAILISREHLEEIMPEHFIFYRPRDIVSGDFYWAHRSQSGKLIFAAVDCTGHGVPGAFMSMVGNALLNEIVIENKVEEPDEILNQMKTGVIHALKQTGAAGEQKDGMDIALCVLEFPFTPKSPEGDLLPNSSLQGQKVRGGGVRLSYAGAYNPLYHFRNGTFTEYKPDKQTVGYQQGKDNPFTKHSIEIQKGDAIYIFTDGFADQKGGPEGRKFYYKTLQQLFASIQSLPMAEQRAVVKKTFNEWKGNYEQIDDICVIGVRV